MNYALEVKDLCKIYPDFFLDHINFALPYGCIMGLIGENGAGKSTILKLILNQIKKDQGDVFLFGQDVSQLTPKIREHIGIVLDEIGIPGCLNAKQIHAIMRDTYQNWDESYFFHSLKELAIPITKPFKDFSRGMKMKLGIVIALSHHPKLLILDEVTNGLDPLARDEVLDVFNEFTRDENHSILLSSHIVSDLEKICDYITFIHKGKLLLCEEKDWLLSQYGVIHCTAEEFQNFNQAAIKGKKESAYGIHVLVERDKIPSNNKIRPINIEDLFVWMAKEE